MTLTEPGSAPTREDLPPAVSRRSLIRGSAGLVATAALSTAVACSPDAPASAGTPSSSRGSEGPTSTAVSARTSASKEPVITSATTTAAAQPSGTRSAGAGRADALFAEFDAKIEAAMAADAVPGVAVGIWYQGREYLKGYGVTSVEAPQPVTPDTIFRIGSTTKTFVGTSIMRLVEAGKLNMDAPVRSYLPDFTTSDPAVAEAVTLRMLLNHTAGWLGDDFQEFGQGADALERLATAIADLPILTRPGSTFAYNNAAVALAGRVIEVVTGQPYEQAIQELLLDPLALDHTRFLTDDLVGYSLAAGHSVADGKAHLNTSFWFVPRSVGPTGGLMSSARDQLRYARFHLGHDLGSAARKLLSSQSLTAMRKPGPSGTLIVELDGMGVTWQLRPTAEGARIVQHGGNWAGQHSGFLIIPERDFAMTVLTNSSGGPVVLTELFAGEWALTRFAGLHNLPATAQVHSTAQLSDYAGRFTAQGVDRDGTVYTNVIRLTAADGRLHYRLLDENDVPLPPPAKAPASLAFYRKDHLLVMGIDGEPLGTRCDFVRSADGAVQWLRMGGRLFRKAPD